MKRVLNFLLFTISLYIAFDFVKGYIFGNDIDFDNLFLGAVIFGSVSFILFLPIVFVFVFTALLKRSIFFSLFLSIIVATFHAYFSDFYLDGYITNRVYGFTLVSDGKITGFGVAAGLSKAFMYTLLTAVSASVTLWKGLKK